VSEYEPIADPVRIPLKRKYLSTFKPPKHGINGDHQGKHKRNKIGYAKHVAMFGEPPKMLLLVKANGKKVMVRV
jgi:hypothetical protein